MVNFTVTPERQKQVDFANPYMKVALGVIVPESSSIKSIDDLKGKKVVVDKGTTAEVYFTKNYPDIQLIKFDQNTETFQALKDGRADALSHDNTLLFAWANENKGYKVIEGNLGEQDVIAPAVKKGNKELLDWINNELTALGKENFMHKAYDQELKPYFGDSVKNPDDVVIEGGVK